MILVTGGTGYIGSHTVVSMIEQGYEPLIVDNFVNSKPEVLDRIEMITGKRPLFYEADIRDEEKMEQIFSFHSGLLLFRLSPWSSSDTHCHPSMSSGARYLWESWISRKELMRHSSLAGISLIISSIKVIRFLAILFYIMNSKPSLLLHQTNQKAILQLGIPKKILPKVI